MAVGKVSPEPIATLSKELEADLRIDASEVVARFDDDEADANAAATGLGPARSELRSAWQGAVKAVLADAQLAVPKDSPFRASGSRGVHSENLGYMLAEMQHLQRTYPGGQW